MYWFSLNVLYNIDFSLSLCLEDSEVQEEGLLDFEMENILNFNYKYPTKTHFNYAVIIKILDLVWICGSLFLLCKDYYSCPRQR